MKKTLISILTFILVHSLSTAQDYDSVLYEYDSTVCSKAVEHLGDNVCADYVDYLYFRWKGDVNDFDSLQKHIFSYLNDTLVSQYGRDSIVSILVGETEQGTPARIYNMAISSNKRAVIDFAALMTRFVDYTETGLDMESLIGSEVKCYDMHGGDLKHSVLDSVDTSEKIGYVNVGNSTVRCNIYTVRRR